MSSAKTPSETASIRPRIEALLGDRDVRGPAFGRAYAALVDGWLAGLLPEGGGLAIVAVGGYGRRELAPASDLDVVLVHDRKVDGARVADQVWYPIWDAGFRLDHSTRTVKEALSLADRDLKVALGLLDARGIAGEERLSDELVTGARAQWRDRAKRRLPLLEESVRTRHALTGSVAFELEPDLKEGAGGLRDITALRALELALPSVELSEDLLDAGALLFSVRVALQRISGRREERLLLDYQDEVAVALDRVDADELMRDVSQAGRTIAWHVEEALRAGAAAVEGPRGRSRVGADAPLADGIVRRDAEIALTADADPAADPTLLLRVADLSANLGAAIARPTLRRLVAEAPTLPDPWPPGARDALVGFLDAGPDAIHVFETLDQHGLFARVLPEWAAVRSRPQRNAFHRYTVDRHLMECASRAATLTRSVARPDLLLVGAWLHDIGKGFPGDHTDVGVELVGTIGARMGFPPDDVAHLVGMVRHHLLLPSVATSRDLDDPDVIENIAVTVGDVELLDLLGALTEADSRATGETAWSEWKARLVATLVVRVGARLAGAHDAAPDSPVDDTALAARAAGGVLVERPERRLTVAAPDAPGVFSRVVGVLAIHGQEIRTASARRGPNGTAISEFELESRHGGADAPDWDDVERDVRRALTGELAIGARLDELAAQAGRLRRPTAAWSPEPRVVIDNVGSRTATIVEVRAADAVGLLFRIASVFAALGLDITSARVATMGHEVVDSFYVVADGAKVESAARLAELEHGVLHALRANEV